jgi:limonene-1,2-epoxide hydrolase
MGTSETVVADFLAAIASGPAAVIDAWRTDALGTAEWVTPSFGRTVGAAVPDAIGRSWDSPAGAPAQACVDDLISARDTVFAEYTVRDDHGITGRRHAVVSFAGGKVASWRDHGDVPARTSGERSDPVAGGARGAAPRVHDGQVNEIAAEAVKEFFRLHEQHGFEGVLMAWRKFAHPQVVLWHSAEGIRGQGIDEVIAFYTRQHAKYPYSGFQGAPEVMASAGRYVAGEITYLLDRPDGDGVIRLPASFAVDVDDDGRFVSWRDYSRFWIPEPSP